MPVRTDIVRRRRAIAARIAIPALIVVVLTAGFLAAFHLTPVAVYGSSMLPTIEPGDVILVDRRAEPTLGTVVTYTDDSRWITHRVRGIAPDGSLVLRGDANGWDDPLVSVDRAVGVSRLVLPEIGMPVLWARQGRVMPFVLTAAAVAALVALTTMAVARLQITPSGTPARRAAAPRPPTPVGPPAT